ncbi:MAG: pentapeptide repeat-containing protein [Pleurocapsa sp. MO_226.B13]|nr:pentapeptide repeat-containing protein [Pleurocapsa sp. MO_226.B13]
MSINKGDISNFLLNNAIVSTPLSDATDVLRVISSILAFVNNPNDSSDAMNQLNGFGQRGVEFIGKTNLNNVNLSGANLTETKLKSADLFNSNLNNTILNYTDLKDTDLSNSNLIDAQISDSDLEEAFLCNTIMPDVSLSQQGCLDDETATEEDEDS